MLTREEGFTLVELIAVMIILGIIASIAAVKFISFDTAAADKVIDLAIDELNTREKLVWLDVKLSLDGNIKEDVWNRMQQELNIGNGAEVKNATEDGGTIIINGASAEVIRTHPSTIAPGKWARL